MDEVAFGGFRFLSDALKNGNVAIFLADYRAVTQFSFSFVSVHRRSHPQYPNFGVKNNTNETALVVNT